MRLLQEAWRKKHFFKRLDYVVPDFSPHGLRGTAATLLREHAFGRDVVEQLLAHREKNATVAAYSHIELAVERKRALTWSRCAQLEPSWLASARASNTHF
jgi:integrase